MLEASLKVSANSSLLNFLLQTPVLLLRFSSNLKSGCVSVSGVLKISSSAFVASGAQIAASSVLSFMLKSSPSLVA